MAKPWERRENESAKAFAAFEIYRAMGPEDRSIDAVGQKVDKNRTLIGKWSARHAWVARVGAFDASVARAAADLEHKRRVKELDDMRERHKTIGRLALARAAKKLSAEGEEAVPIESTVDVWRLGRLGLLLEQSGHEAGAAPGRATMSGDGDDAGDGSGTEQMIHTLQIEVISDGGQVISGSDLVAKLAAFYDKPEGDKA